MSDVVTFTNPRQNYAGSGGASASVPVTHIGMDFEFGTIGAFTFHIESDIAAKYGLETDHANNPLQKNSTFVYTVDGQQEGVGFVISKPITVELEGAGRFLEVQCHGLDGALARALCPQNGKYIWTARSDSAAVTALPLKKATDFGSFAGDTLWPDPLDTTGAKCYVGDALSPNDILDTTIASGATVPFPIILSTSNTGFGPRGWWKIGSEWCYVEGYDDTAAGNKFKGTCIARAQLGTTAATHSAGATVYYKAAKQLAPGKCELMRDAGSGPIRMRRGKEFEPDPQLGCLVIGGGGGSDTYSFNGRYYDDDATLDAGSVPLFLEDLVELLCTASSAHGGAGFSSGQLVFDATGLAITRYDYNPRDKSPYAWQAIQDEIADIGLEDEVQFWLNPKTGKLRLGIPTLSAPSLSLLNIERVETENSLEDCYSGVLVAYSDDQTVNRVHKDYFTHPGCSASGAKPDRWRWSTEDGGSWDAGTNTTNTGAGAGNFGATALYDGKADTKLAAEFDHDPGGPFYFGVARFNSGATLQLALTRIALRVGNYRAIKGWSRSTANPEFEYVVRLEGCNDYNPAADTDGDGTGSGTWEDLGCELRGKPDAWGVPELVEFTGGFLLQGVTAVRLVFDYMAGPKQGGDHYWAVLHEFIIEGDGDRYAFVQTSDSVDNDPAFLRADDLHKKLRGGPNSSGGPGAARCELFEVGAASDTAALSIGRARLVAKASLTDQRHYTYKGEIAAAAWPVLGDTAEADEDGDAICEYQGIIRAYTMLKTYQGREWTFRLANPEAGVLA